MGFQVSDLKNDDISLSASYWSWRPTVELIRSFRILDDERLDLMQIQSVGTDVTRDEALAIGQRLITDILPKLTTGERIRLDLSITDEPDDGTMYHDEETEKNYSATREWLEEFAAFCLKCEGFSVF